MRVAVYVIPTQRPGEPEWKPMIHSIWTTPEEAAAKAVSLLMEGGFTDVLMSSNVDGPEVGRGKSSVQPS
jgi:hypothetical protein